MIEIKSNLSSDYVFNITSEIISSIRKDNNIITYLKAAAKAYSNMTFTEIVKELYHFITKFLKVMNMKTIYILEMNLIFIVS